MGSSCSIELNDKYNSVKKFIIDSNCMKLYAIDGLLSLKNNSIVLLGEHHSENEGNSCLDVLDIVTKVTSPNECEDDEKIFFLYENPVISDNAMFLKEDHNFPFFDGQEKLSNIHGTRFHVITKAVNYKNIKAIPIDVFGRMRSFNFRGGDQRNPNHTQEVAINELGEFWKSIGYPSDFIQFVAPNALQIAQDMTNVFFNTIPNSDMTSEEILEVFTCVSLAKLSLVVNEDDENSSKTKDYVMSYIDEFVGILMSVEPEKNKNAPIVEIDDIESLRNRIRIMVAFELISIAGDMVLYEYISFANRKNRDTLTLMHAGFNHTNRLRLWLNFSEYNHDLERVSPLALDDITFNSSRNKLL